MIDKENHYKPKTILETIFEMTHNRWEHVTVNDFNRAATYKINKDSKSTIKWIRFESKDERKQLEVIHLNILLTMIDEENFLECCNHLIYQKPDPENRIQPLFNPYMTGENREILLVEVDSQETLIISEKSYLTEFPGEV